MTQGQVALLMSSARRWSTVLRDLYVFTCVILFLCFSILLVLWLPRLGKRELILVLFVRLFGLCLFRFVGFLFLFGSGKGCGLWLWHSLDFSLTFFVLNNRRIKVAELASECGISNGSVYTIIHEHLGMSKVSARWVPRNLNMQDRQQRVESSQELLEVYNANPEDFHTRLVTGDETWLHHLDPDTKKRVHAMEAPWLTPT